MTDIRTIYILQDNQLTNDVFDLLMFNENPDEVFYQKISLTSDWPMIHIPVTIDTSYMIFVPVLVESLAFVF